MKDEHRMLYTGCITNKSFMSGLKKARVMTNSDGSYISDDPLVFANYPRQEFTEDDLNRIIESPIGKMVHSFDLKVIRSLLKNEADKRLDVLIPFVETLDEEIQNLSAIADDEAVTDEIVEEIMNFDSGLLNMGDCVPMYDIRIAMTPNQGIISDIEPYTNMDMLREEYGTQFVNAERNFVDEITKVINEYMEEIRVMEK